MDMSKSTPQMIYEYKQDWKPNGYSVSICSDLDVKGKMWCRDRLERWQWSMSTFTDHYEHTFHFEFEEDAEEFKEYFK